MTANWYGSDTSSTDAAALWGMSAAATPATPSERSDLEQSDSVSLETATPTTPAPADVMITVLDKDGGEHKFGEKTLKSLGPDFIINVLTGDLGATEDVPIPTILPATILKALAAYIENGTVPNPYLVENRVEDIPPGTLLEYLGIEDKEVCAGDDYDCADDLSQEELDQLRENKIRARGRAHGKSHSSNDEYDDDEYDDDEDSRCDLCRHGCAMCC